ncbi:MAG: class I SAM-dependent methyltransferase [Verrucomicrobiota bacterium]
MLHEDEHFLVVNKPAGWNTHAPSPHAGEGLYEWLRHREVRWAKLAIIHRLDKETSGLLVFGKTATANRSLTEQFTRRDVRKKYLLLSPHELKQPQFTAQSRITRAGERYVSGPHGEVAETHFSRVTLSPPQPGCHWIAAEPLTGRTHQIRVHAAEHGFPILGDTLYGGAAFPRVCLHAAEIAFSHPATGKTCTFQAPPDFLADARAALRSAVIEATLTNAFRLIHGAADGWPGWYVERLGDFLLSQSEQPLTSAQRHELTRLLAARGARGAHHKILNRQVRRSNTEETSPPSVLGEAAPDRFAILENGVRFELSFQEGYSVGLFLDQRDNRRRFLSGHVAADFPLAAAEVLNVFAYTCGFSVCAARAGARVTSLDLSKKYLEWGRRNFLLNDLDPGAHDFIFGDAFDWLRRLQKKGRRFDVIVLDPPTFSQSKEHGAFRVEKDFGKLVTAAVPLLNPGGVLLASTNAAEWYPEDFLGAVEMSARQSGRKILQEHYVPQPPDFPVHRAEPAYLKTVWLRLG